MALVTTKQAAELLGMSARGVGKLIERGRLPSVRIGVQHMLRVESVRRMARLMAKRPNNRSHIPVR